MINFYEVIIIEEGNTAIVLCGHFCVFYAVKKFYNTDSSMEEILTEEFSYDKKKNERKVLRFLKKWPKFQAHNPTLSRKKTFD